MTGRNLGGVPIEVVRGDIADQPDVDAIVDAADAQLETGGQRHA